jgi:WD40 repeat protein
MFLNDLIGLKGYSSKVNCIAFSTNGNYLASGSDDKIIKLWNIETNKNVGILRGHHKCITSLAFSPDSRYLVSSSSDCRVKLWNVMELIEVKTFIDHS